MDSLPMQVEPEGAVMLYYLGLTKNLPLAEAAFWDISPKVGDSSAFHQRLPILGTAQKAAAG